MKVGFIAALGLCLAAWLAPAAWAQDAIEGDPLDYLDADRYGAGTLIAAMELLSTYMPDQAIDPVRPLQAHPDPDVARVLPEHESGPGGGADRASGVVLGEPHPLRRHAIEARRRDLSLAVASEIGPAQVIGHDENEVRASRGDIVRHCARVLVRGGARNLVRGWARDFWRARAGGRGDEQDSRQERG